MTPPRHIASTVAESALFPLADALRSVSFPASAPTPRRKLRVVGLACVASTKRVAAQRLWSKRFGTPSQNFSDGRSAFCRDSGEDDASRPSTRRSSALCKLAAPGRDDVSRSKRSSEPTRSTYREMERRLGQALFEPQEMPGELAGCFDTPSDISPARREFAEGDIVSSQSREAHLDTLTARFS